MTSNNLERYATALIYDHSTALFDHPDQLSSGLACPRHAGVSEGRAEQEDDSSDANAYSDGKAGGLITYVKDVSTEPENIACSPQSPSKRGSVFVLRGTKHCKDQERERAYYSGNAFACIPYLYRLRFEVRGVPPPSARETRQYFKVTKVVRMASEECTIDAVVALLRFVLDKREDKVHQILRMGGYDFDRDAMLYPPGETGPFLGDGFNNKTEPADFRARHLAKYRLMIEILEYSQERSDSTRNRAYILKAMELHFPETFKRMARDNPDIEAAYDSLLYSPEMIERARQHEDYTAIEQCQRVSKAMAFRRRKELKDACKVPMSVQVQRHPEVVQYFTADVFQKLEKYRNRDWLFGLTVEEVYQLHDLLFNKATLELYSNPSRLALTERLRCRNLLPAYRLCFAPLMREDYADEAHNEANYLDVDFTSYPHAYTTRKMSSVAREMSITQLLNYLDDVCPLNDDNEYDKGVVPVLTEAEIFDVYMYRVVQTIPYRDGHDSLRVADLYERVRFDLGFASMASLVEDQMNHHSIQNPKAVAARRKLSARLLPRLDDDLYCDDRLLRARIYASVCRLAALVQDPVMEMGRGNGQVVVLESPSVDDGLLIDDMILQLALEKADDTEAMIAEAEKLNLDNYRVYITHSYNDQQLIVEGVDSVCVNFVSSKGCLPTKRPFFALVEREGWPLAIQRLWLAWYRQLDAAVIFDIHSAALVTLEEEWTPEQQVVAALDRDYDIVLPEHELCPEQMLAELSFRHFPLPILSGAAGSGKSALVARLLQQLEPGTVMAMTFMLSHAHNLANMTGMKEPNVCTIDQALTDHHTTCCNMEAGMPASLKKYRKVCAGLKESPMFQIVGGSYIDCPFETLEVLIFDEYGTIDNPRFAKIVTMMRRCCPRLRRILFCGDLMQLVSIGAGDLARDLAYIGTVPFEHMHRAGCEDLIQLSRAINDNRPDRMELSTDYIKFFPCTTEAWEKAWKRDAADNIGAIIKDIFRCADLPDSRLAYLDSMVTCDSRAMCKAMAGIIDYERLRRLKLGPKVDKRDRTLMEQAAWSRAKKSMTYQDSGRFRTDRFFPGQKIAPARTFRDIGLVNGEVVVVMAVVKGWFMHMSQGKLAALYEECFEHICSQVVQYATVQGFSSSLAPEPIQRLIEAYDRDELFARKVRNCAYVDMKKHIADQATCQRLEANALIQFMAGKFNRTEVHVAKRCSEGLSHGARNLGYTWMHHHPLTVRRRTLVNERWPLSASDPTAIAAPDAEQGADQCIDWILQAEYVLGSESIEALRKATEEAKNNDRPEPKGWTFSDRVMQMMQITPEDDKGVADFIRGPLRQTVCHAMSDLLNDTSSKQHAVAFDGTADASMVAQASAHGPCFDAIRRAAESYYAEGKDKVKVTKNDYLSFRVGSASLSHSGITLDQAGRDGPCGIKFLQCYALGNPRKIIYIPIISSVTNHVKSAATTTVHRAQSNNAGTIIPVIPYPVERKKVYTAVTRASDGLMPGRRQAGLGNNCWIISSDTFALARSMEMTTMPRQSVLGYKLRVRCLTRLRQSGLLDECEEELCEIREMHQANVDRTKRDGETKEERDRRVRAHGKHYAFTMPWNQVLPARCFGREQMKYLRDMQDSLPLHMYDDQWMPTPQLMTKEEHGQCLWRYEREEDHDAYLWDEAGWQSSSDMEVDE